MRWVGGIDLLERVAADEVVVELDHVGVPELERVQVVVLDVVRDEAARERVVRLIAVGGQPLAVAAQPFARVDGGQRRRDPARFERVGRICARSAREQPELGARLEDRLARLVVGLVRPPQLEAGLAGHAVTQGAHALARDVHLRHAEELQLLDGSSVQLLDDWPGVRALDLKAPVHAGDRLTVWTTGGAVVELEVELVAAGLGLVLEPVGDRRAAHPHELLVVEMEEDAVPDHVTRRRRRDVLLGHVDREVRDAVDGRVGHHLQGIRALEEEVDHVVGLVEEHGGLAPGALLAAPVAELVGDDRVDVGADLRVAKQLDDVARLVEYLLEIAWRHDVAPSSRWT